MYINKIAALAGAVAVINQVAALNINRRENKLENKPNIVWKTVVEDIYVNKDGSTAGARLNDAGNDAGKVAGVVVPAPAPKNERPPVQKGQAPALTGSKESVKPDTPNDAGSNTGASSKRPKLTGKRGLAHNEPTLANLVGSSCKKCGWAYNWGQVAGALDAKFLYVPMLWGKGPHNTNFGFFNSWRSNAAEAIAHGAQVLLSFNEPDIPEQANMSPTDAVSNHVEYMNPFSGKALIASPAISNSNRQGEGLEWLKNWVQECNNTPRCEFDLCAVHWYDHVDAIENLFEFLDQVHKISQKPVLLTEFGPSKDSTTDQAVSLLKQALPRLDALEYLDAYAYFMVGTEPLQLLSSGPSGPTLSPIGKVYVNSQ